MLFKGLSKCNIALTQGLYSVQRTLCFLFATANGLCIKSSLFSKRSRVTN